MCVEGNSHGIERGRCATLSGVEQRTSQYLQAESTETKTKTQEHNFRTAIRLRTRGDAYFASSDLTEAYSFFCIFFSPLRIMLVCRTRHSTRPCMHKPSPSAA